MGDRADDREGSDGSDGTDRRVRALQFAAVQVVGAVAVVHFAVGTEQLAGIVANGLLVEYLTGRVLARPRALLFVVSSVAALAGLVAAGRGRLRRATAYRLGIALLATYLAGWLAWHTVLDHGTALAGAGAGRAAESLHDHGGLFATVGSHYVAPIVETLVAAGSGAPGTGRTLLGVVSVTLELVGIGLLVALLWLDPAARADGGSGSFRSWLAVDRPERADGTDDAGPGSDSGQG